MKITITIQDGDVRLSITPETELEKLAMRELGDDVSVSRSYESMVLRQRRATNVRKITNSCSPVDWFLNIVLYGTNR